MMQLKEAVALKRERRWLYLDDFEHRPAVVGMNYFRNYLIQTGKPTEDVDALLLKLLKAKTKRRLRETPRSGTHRVRHRKRITQTNEWRETQCKN